MAKTLEGLRDNVFWFNQKMTGNKIANHLHDISIILSENGSSLSQAQNEKNLGQILSHSVSSVPYYYGLRQFSTLDDFPVVEKQIIRTAYNSFRSLSFKDADLFTAVTSGSTGTPFRIYQDKNKKLRNYADTLYFAGLAGYEPGQKLIYLKIWVSEKMKNRLVYRLQNMVPVDVIHFNDREIEKLIADMKSDRSTFSLLGYASALELICQYLDRTGHGPVKANVKSVIGISESLNDYTIQSFKKYFGVPAVSRYSNLENGIIAQQTPDSSGRFLVNTASYHVEILKMDSDERAVDGEPGRIVVTDLFNYAMPMIRYDTGDVGSIIKDASAPGRKYLATVEGRKLDLLYDTRGNLVSSYIVYKNMWQYTEIDQYQLIQERGKEYTFKINCRDAFTREDQLVSEFKTYLGKDADFKIEYVSEIPLLASGKRKKIVNNYIKS